VKIPKAFVLILFFFFALAAVSKGIPRQAQSDSPAAGELTAILEQFMQDATHGNAAGFESFFADDVIYTRSAGAVITKADIMRSMRGAAPNPAPTTTYSAEDITVHQYGDTAIVAFRLVRRDDHGAGNPPTLMNYRNTGTFLRRGGHWQAVAWQSTIVPDTQPTK
jgi:ketosteroid isomerase-like protein